MLFPQISDGFSIKIYIFNPYLKWERLQLVDLFLALFLSIKKTSNYNAENITWIQDDIYDCWYYTLDILRSLFIIKVARLFMDKEANIATGQKNKKILLKIVNKM